MLDSTVVCRRLSVVRGGIKTDGTPAPTATFEGGALRRKQRTPVSRGDSGSFSLKGEKPGKGKKPETTFCFLAKRAPWPARGVAHWALARAPERN